MMKKVFVSILLLALVFAAFGGQAFAADPPQNPPYRVRLFAGNSNVGVLTASQDSELGYEDPYSFDATKVDVVDERYYVKGFREAGKDNSTGLYVDTYNKVVRDMDFVVAYGMKGSAVEYTVNFVDNDGETLADSRTLYANVGDKPIVSYIYIDGYQPQAYALTKTLTENPGDNVFNFTYTETEPITVTTVEIVGGGAPVLPAGNAGAQPEEIIDLDTPLAGPDGTEGGMTGGWKATDSADMSKEATAAFEKAMEGIEGVKYEPVAYLAQQQDSGTNYAVLCKAKDDSPDAQPYYAIVYINENPEGNAKVLDIVSMTRNGEVDKNAAAKQKKDSWPVAEEQEPGIGAFKKAVQNLLGVKYTPVYVLSSQKDASGTDYCVLAHAKPVTPEAEAYYILATVHEDASGDVKITEFRNLDIGAIYEESVE